MKITTLLLTLSLVSLYATGYSQQEKLTIHKDNASVKEIIAFIEEKSGYKFLYNDDYTELDRTISINADQKPISDILSDLFQDSGTGYKLLENKLIVVLPLAYLQQKAITGTVTDETNGEPLPGVNIIVEGTNTGVTTDINGKYTIEIPGDNTVLVFSYLGYLTENIQVAGKSVIDMKLSPDIIKLDEIVVIGYGIQKKRDVSNAVSTVNPKQIKDLPVMNVAQALTGQVSGVSTQATTGNPGDAPVIRVRGVGSFSSSNDPLIVVDGYPLNSIEDFNSINPNDIESIQILKDAASTAIYGSRGGNGVIIVTTKKGKAGKPQLNFSASYGVNTLAKKIEMLNTEQFLEYSNEAFTERNASNIPAAYSDPNFHFANTDWQDVIFRNAMTKNLQLSVLGGTEKLKYMISSGYTNEEGILRGTDYERYNFRANLNAKLNNKLNVGFNLSPTYIKRDQRPVSSDNGITQGYYSNIPSIAYYNGAVYSALIQPPIIPVYQEHNGIKDYDSPSIDDNFKNTAINQSFFNPLAILNETDDYTHTMQIIGNLYLEYEILRGLTFKSSFGGDAAFNQRNIFWPSYIAFNTGTTASYSNPNTAAIRDGYRSWKNYGWVWDQTLTFDRTLSEKHHFTFLAGYSAEKHGSESVGTYGKNYVSDGVRLPEGASNTSGDRTYSFLRGLNTLISYFGRLNYSYGEKYYLMATYRRDGSSKFGSKVKWASFPSFSAAWRLSEEEFLKNRSLINELKLRGSYGETGVNSIGDFQTEATLTSSGLGYGFGTGTGTMSNGYAPNGISNPTLTWETNKQLDLGIDVAILKGRFSLSAELYKRTSEGMLANTSVSALVGFTSSMFRNIGSVENKGIELEVISNNLTGDFKWTTSLNYSRNKNKITKFYSKDPVYYDAVFGFNTAYILREGGSLGDVYGMICDGVYKDQSEVDAGPIWNGDPALTAPGDPRFKDTDGNGILNLNDQAVFTNLLPKCTYGITNTFSFKGFDLMILLQGVYGQKVIDGVGRNLVGTLDGRQNAPVSVLNRWKSPTEPGDGTMPKVNISTSLRVFSDRFVMDASFLRIRDITLAYNLPVSVITKLKLQNMRLYVTLQNVYTFTKYYGFDPEVNIEGSSAVRMNVEQGSYPLPRTATFGITLSF